VRGVGLQEGHLLQLVKEAAALRDEGVADLGGLVSGVQTHDADSAGSPPPPTALRVHAGHPNLSNRSLPPTTNTPKARTLSRYAVLVSAAHAAVSAATLTLYGCLARHMYCARSRGKAPHPTRRPASAAHLLKVRRTTRLG
jgi:hypothetical protein